MAASLVAFGPALVLEYVPTKKVDVQDMASAGSKAGRVSRVFVLNLFSLGESRVHIVFLECGS